MKFCDAYITAHGNLCMNIMEQYLYKRFNIHCCSCSHILFLPDNVTFREKNYAQLHAKLQHVASSRQPNSQLRIIHCTEHWLVTGYRTLLVYAMQLMARLALHYFKCIIVCIIPICLPVTCIMNLTTFSVFI